MTPDQLAALAARLRDHAAMHESVVPNDDELRQWRDDLIAAAQYLRQCSQAEPVAWLHPANSSCVTTDPDGYARGIPLYTHPQPQQVGVPAGWKLVPVEPTTEMVVAAFDAIPASLLDGKIRTHYRAMLAAAPHPPSAQSDAVEALRRIIEAANGRQRHNPITDEMNAALRYARAVLAAHGGNR